MRVRHPRVGLRTKLVAALVATAAVTLIAAALALLSPLEQRLKAEEVKSLTAATVSARPALTDGDLARHRAAGDPELRRLARRLQRRTGGRVTVVDPAWGVLFDTDPDARPVADKLVPDALATRGPIKRVVGGPDGPRAVVALAATNRREPVVLVVTKSLTDVTRAVAVVQRAILVAALVGLITALLVGTALASTLLRRLRRLRKAAAELDPNTPGPPMPNDGTRDEVGDLARALASMSERLRRQEEARKTFVSTASHELRTPLASLDGMLELLQEDLATDGPDAADAVGQVARLREQSRRLGLLAAELLDLSRLDAGVSLRRELIELGALTRAVLGEFAVRASENDVRLVLATKPPRCWAIADPAAVARIVRILADNALRFAPAGSAVRVGVTVGRTARIAVTDEGPGVPAEERAQIFERFRRGTHTGGAPGFGLGLALGRELAERMEGRLDLEPSDVGARFVVDLVPAPATIDDDLRPLPARPTPE
jgi:signal transduction histidine kinase